MKYLLITKQVGLKIYSDYAKFSTAVVAMDNEGLDYINMDISLLAGVPTGRYSFWSVSDSTAAAISESYEVA